MMNGLKVGTKLIQVASILVIFPVSYSSLFDDITGRRLVSAAVLWEEVPFVT